MYSNFQPHFFTLHPENSTESVGSSDLDFDDDSVVPVIREEDPSLLAAVNQLFPDFPSAVAVIDWDLPSQTIKHLQSIERFDYFDQERQKPLFPAEYAPKVVDILYDDMLALSSESGCVTYRAKRIPTEITLVEFYFDDQLGLALIHGNTIVDRISAMANLDAYLGRLPGVSA